MPDYNKKTRQRIKETSVRLACDANDMSIVEFGKLIIEQDKVQAQLEVEDRPQT